MNEIISAIIQGIFSAILDFIKEQYITVKSIIRTIWNYVFPKNKSKELLRNDIKNKLNIIYLKLNALNEYIDRNYYDSPSTYERFKAHIKFEYNYYHIKKLQEIHIIDFWNILDLLILESCIDEDKNSIFKYHRYSDDKKEKIVDLIIQYFVTNVVEIDNETLQDTFQWYESLKVSDKKFQQTFFREY